MLGSRRNILIVWTVFFAGLIAGILLVIVLQTKPQPAPDTSRLKDLLHITAQKTIGLPPIADAEVELTIERGKLDMEIARIKTLAEKFGGTAVQGGTDDTGADVLAEISPQFTAQFMEALRHPEKQPVAQVKPENNQTALVQVRLKFQS
jgi:hypothetical protein